MGPVRIVIVGGSFGGLTTAYELRRDLTLTGRPMGPFTANTGA